MKLRHRETGVETELSAEMEVGRLSSCGLRVADGSVSRHHARVLLRGGEWWLVDLGSSNGSKRNGRKEKEFPLRSGDLVTIGAVAFDVVGPSPATAPATAPSAPAAAAEAPSTTSAPPRPGPRQPREKGQDLELARSAREAETERARIHAELRARQRSGGFGDLNQLSFGMQLLVGLLGLVFLVAVVYGVRWLGEAM